MCPQDGQEGTHKTFKRNETERHATLASKSDARFTATVA